MSLFNAFTIVLAASGQDLFQFSEGNLYEVQGLVNVLGGFAVKVISIVGFGIVIFSILKNAMSGLYVVNPSFWDKVDDIKNQAVAGVSGTVNEMVGKTNGNYAAQKLGGLFTFLLNLIPNIKALTDFDDGAPVDKKQYFMKSIPLLIAQIFIGMLIFFGYPAKIANWIGTGGTHVITAMLNNIDPVEVVSGVSDVFTVYSLATDGSPEPFDQTVNKCASEMIRVIQTKYSDMQKDPTQETAYAVESFLQQALESDTVRAIIGASEGYDIKVNAQATSSVPTYSGAFKAAANQSGLPCMMAQSTSGIVQIKTWIAGSSLPTGSTKVGSDDYFVWTITATPVSISKTSSSNLIVFGGFNTPTNTSDGHLNLTLTGITIGSGKGDVRGVPGNSIIVDAVASDGTIKNSYTATLTTASVQQSTGAAAILQFASTDRTQLLQDVNSGCYLKLNLTGSWSYDVQTTQNNQTSTVTLNVSEIRVASGGSIGFALSIWDDVTMAISQSTVKDASVAIKQGNMAGTAGN